MRRRRFIQSVGIGAAAFALRPRLARATWGDVDPATWPGTSGPASSLLEIYLWGGMAPWESFYYRPVSGSQTRGFDSDATTLTWNTAACPGTPAGLVSQFLAKDLGGTGKDIHLGPFAKPLWRSDISSRTRVIAVYHDLAPHEAAIPYALSGRRLGRPDATGLGAPIQRRARALDVTNAHPLPFSYCLVPPTALGNPMFASIDAIGSHGGNSKPVVLPIGPSSATFVANLTRTVPSGADALIAEYTQIYENRLKPAGAAAAARSAAFQDFKSAAASLASAPSLATLLGGAPLTAGSAPFCSTDTGTFATGNHFAGSALQTAAFLLNHPDAAKRASYVSIIDGGLQNVGFAYDVHDTGGPPGQAQRTSSNLWETLSTLASVIRAPGDPPSPTKIDLDSTLIVIRTEFGRTPYRSIGGAPSAGSSGRDHWPEGYASVLIGGPIKAAGVAGSISDGTGGTGQGIADTSTSYQPQDVQAAALLGIGIDPFADGNLPVGDLSPSLQGTHAVATNNLRQQLLGV